MRTKSKLNSEKIWKMRKKSRLNSVMIWKIWKISVLVIITPKETSSSSAASTAATDRWIYATAAAAALLPLYMYIHCFSELRRIILKQFFCQRLCKQGSNLPFDSQKYHSENANTPWSTTQPIYIYTLYENKRDR